MLMRLIGWAAGTGAAAGGTVTALLVLVLALHRGPTMGTGACLLPSGLSCQSPHASVIVQEALLLQDHVYGREANVYDLQDPVIQSAYHYWVNWCGNGLVPCHQAVSGNLQCVSFVNAVYALSGVPLPASGNGVDFWPLYEHVAGWLRIPSSAFAASLRGWPQPGDLIAWKGGPFGHVAVIIDVVFPQQGRDGSVTVAQANAPGNRWPQSRQAEAGNWYTMVLHPDRTLVTWPGLVVQGYLRQLPTTASSLSAGGW